MKKALKIIGIIVVVIFLLLLILPFAFKGKIIELVKKEANKNLKAKVEFADVDLSLIRNFPNLAVSIQELSVVGVAPFEGDTLAAMKDLNLTLDIMSVINGEQIEVKKIGLDEPVINVLVREDGTANYDIVKESAEDTTTAEAGGEAMKLTIDEYEISNGRVVYDDQTLPMVLRLMELNHTGKGDFAEDIFTLETNTHIGSAIVDYDGIRYVNGAAADLKADIAMDLNQMKFTFKENELALNQLTLGFDGWLAMPEEDIDMDITFDAKKNDLKTLLSLVPAEFTQDLDGVEAEGKIALSGYVKGTYNDKSMPGFGLNLGVDNGRVQYPDLPKSIENIRIDAKIKSPEGADMDAMTVDVPTFHMELGKSAANPNTIDARLSLRNPMSDPFIDTKVDADLNLGDFKDVVPLEEDFSLKGMFTAHFELKGAMSSIENQQFDKFKARGSATLSNFAYSDREVAAQIPEAEVEFTPQKLALNRLDVIYEEINMSLDGYMNNYVAYALTDTTLQGVFNFKADKINVNKLMGDEGDEAAAAENEESSEEAPADTSDTPGEPILVPDNLDITLNAEIGEMTYDKLVLSAIKGEIGVKNEVAALRQMGFNLLGGSATMDGSYNTQNHAAPMADFEYDIDNIGISDAAEAFNTVSKYAPIAKYASGKVSSKLKLSTEVNAAMEPVYETMQGRGTLHTDEVVLEGSDFLKKMANTLNAPQMATQRIKDINATFVIEDGKITTEPFDVKINSISATVSGWSSFEEKIDYLMEMKVPREELGGDFNKLAESLLSSANSFLGGNMSMGDVINVDLRIHGDLADPKITPSFAGMEGKNVTEQATEAVKEVVEEKIEEGKEKVREEAAKQAEKILKDAQEEADKVVAEAKKAADRIRSEADKQAQKLIDEASNPIAKQGAKIAAKQVREQAEKQASNLESEAQKQADKIMAEARKQADKIKNE